MGNKINQTKNTKKMVAYLGTKAEFDKCLEENKLVVIDFTATWCPPCKMIGPKFEAMAAEEGYAGITFKKCDVDANSESAQAAGIACMPTFKFYKDKAEVEKLEGASEDKLRELLNKYK